MTGLLTPWGEMPLPVRDGTQAPDRDAAVPVSASAGTAVALADDAIVTLQLVAAALGCNLDEAAGRAIHFYAGHPDGAGLPALADALSASRAAGAPAGPRISSDGRSALRASPELQGRAAAARLVHTQDVAGSSPASATNTQSREHGPGEDAFGVLSRCLGPP